MAPTDKPGKGKSTSTKPTATRMKSFQGNDPGSSSMRAGHEEKEETFKSQFNEDFEDHSNLSPRIPFFTNAWQSMTDAQRRMTAKFAILTNKACLARSSRAAHGQQASRLLELSKLSGTDTTQIDQPTAERWIGLMLCDTLLCVRYIMATISTNDHEKVGVLNFASSTTPGGTYLLGTMGQEEYLCARTTLMSSLNPEWYKDSLRVLDLIYSPDILIWSFNGKDRIPPEKQLWIDVISCAAIQCTQTKKIIIDGKEEETWADPDVAQLMELKIRGVLRAATT